MSKRNYRKEYDNYHAKVEQKKRRAGRNRDAKKVKCSGDVDHKDGNPRNGARSNLRCQAPSMNRSFKRTKTARKA